MKKLPFFDIDIRYLRYFTQHRVVLITAFTALLGSTLMGIIAPWPMKYIVDNVIGQEPFTDSFGQWLVSWMGMSREAQVVGFGSLMLIFTGLTALFEFGESYLQKVVQSRATFRLRSDVFAHIQSLSMGFHDNMRSGEVINRVSKDTERIIDGLISSMGDIITSVVKFVGLVITMLFLNWRLALIAFAYIPLSCLPLPFCDAGPKPLCGLLAKKKVFYSRSPMKFWPISVLSRRLGARPMSSSVSISTAQP